jgi:hypothetical protein
MVRHDCILLIAAPQASPPASRLATLATLTNDSVDNRSRRRAAISCRRIGGEEPLKTPGRSPPFG